MTDTIVIGGGLFGQVIAAALRDQGQSVRVIDDRQPLAGSGPAACLMKPTWFAGLGKEVHEPALAMLDRLYGIQDLPFDVHVGNAGKIAQQTVHWIPPAKILAGPTEHWRVTKLGQKMGGMRLVEVSGPGPARGMDQFFARNIVVAAGIWTEALLPQFKQAGQRGMALLYPGNHPPRGIIKPWAPYRQLVAFDRGDGLWVGDGSAIKQANWTQAREEEVAARELKLARRIGDVAPPDEVRRLHGIRPYTKAKPCLLEEVSPGLWVASGGAKNGTVAAGYCAHVLASRLS